MLFLYFTLIFRVQNKKTLQYTIAQNKKELLKLLVDESSEEEILTKFNFYVEEFKKSKSSLPLANSTCSSVVSRSSEKIMELSKNAVRKKDTSRPNAYANFMIDSSKKGYAESKSENEDNDDYPVPADVDRRKRGQQLENVLQ
ncbi:hypothetical protein DAPPUDRAFT_325584 [Daphnia pulex]|uniref:Uncharacterized protein n=1 Tax=Daphnia pulex TaxID=6669 RepID=E9H568_DAPPU|nr:hypothetical protein DAPPUDRAFT_325584 [Daphnia pulex]|eukprot:EFX73077.1 hypothetical protein DAPPUDRAFT_325584 [Daphnia pulex]